VEYLVSRIHHDLPKEAVTVVAAQGVHSNAYRI